MLFSDWSKQHFLNSTSEWVHLAWGIFGLAHRPTKAKMSSCVDQSNCVLLIHKISKFSKRKKKNLFCLKFWIFLKILNSWPQPVNHLMWLDTWYHKKLHKIYKDEYSIIGNQNCWRWNWSIFNFVLNYGCISDLVGWET